MSRAFKKIGQYKVIQFIDTGAFGDVYLVERNKKRFALKKLKSVDLDPEYSRRFFQEAGRVEKLRAKYKLDYLVPVIDILHRHNAYVMEYLDESSSGYFSHYKDSDFLLCLIRAVHQLHTLDVEHRDLKPQNIRVKNARPVLIDFGVASWWDSKSNLMPLGTRVYSPPEMACILGEFTNTSASRKSNRDLEKLKKGSIPGWLKYVKQLHDVYSLGITVGELLTGELPFQAKSNAYMEYLDKGESDVIKEWRNKIPSRFREFVRSATLFSPLDRPLLADLIPVLDVEPFTELIYNFDDEDTARLERDFTCLKCSRDIVSPVEKCPVCHSGLTYLELYIDPFQHIVTGNLPPSVKLFDVPGHPHGKQAIVIDLKGDDFTIKLGRASTQSHIAFTDDNWMSRTHGVLTKTGLQVCYREGYNGVMPPNRGTIDNGPVGDANRELLSNAVLALGRTKFKIRKFFGNTPKEPK